MTTLEKILENLKTMPESTQAEVLDFVEYLKSKEERRSDGYQWGKFSLDSAMRGIAEEASPYGVKDIKEKF
jgi:erythromycin esterase-like protein